MVYRTGAYPEGNPYTDLFIHAVDLSVFLFGKAEIRDFQLSERNGAATIQMLLSHGNVMGFIELSTAFSWSNPEETLANKYHGGRISANRNGKAVPLSAF